MDIDVIARHIPGLLEFKKRIEALLEGAEPGLGGLADGIKAEIAEIRSHLSETADAVSSLQKLKDEVDAAIARAINSIEEKLAAVTADLDAKLAESASIADWFKQNREALEVLLSIGDDLAPKPDPAAQPAADPVTVVDRAADPVEPALEQQASTDQPVS